MFGKIKHKTTKGFAFIRQQQTKDGAPVQDIFLHHTEYLGDWTKLQARDTVEFTLGLRRGNPIGMDVTPVASESGGNDEQV